MKQADKLHDMDVSLCCMQMVSAEYISANVKFGKNANFFFNKPMAFAGNQLWMDERSDNAKQLTRRLLLLAFQTLVTVKDTDLKHQMRLQMPAIIVKSARAFQTFLAFKGNRGECYCGQFCACHSCRCFDVWIWNATLRCIADVLRCCRCPVLCPQILR